MPENLHYLLTENKFVHVINLSMLIKDRRKKSPAVPEFQMKRSVTPLCWGMPGVLRYKTEVNPISCF